MPNIKTNIHLVYNALLSSGYMDLGTEDDFAKRMQDENNRKKVYNALKGNGYSDVGKDFNSFSGMVYEAPKPQQAQQPAQTKKEVGQVNAQVDANVKPTVQTPTTGNGSQQQTSAMGIDFTKPMLAIDENGKYDYNKMLENSTGWKPAPIFDMETSIDKQGNKVTRAQTVPGGPGKSFGKMVYRDWLTGKEYNPEHTDEETQEAISRGKQLTDHTMAYDNVENLSDKNRQQVNGMLPRIDDMLNKRGMELDKENLDFSWRDMPRGSGVAIHTYNTATSNGRLADTEWKNLYAAHNALADAKRMIAEADKSVKEGNFDGFILGAGRGFGDKAFDVRTWDMGVTDASDAGALTMALQDFDDGKKLTESQQALLDAKAVQLATNAYFGSSIGRGYKAGGVTAESIPFMLEMCINPASGAGRTAQSMLTRYALKRFGKEAVKKNAKKYMAAKVATRVTGDIAGSAAMTATTGSVRTLADAESRMSGDVQFNTDDNGNSVFAGHTEGDTPGDAFRKAFVNTTIENYSEMMGEYFAPVIHLASKPVGKALSKGLDKLGMSKVNKFIADVAASDVAKAVNDFEKHAKWHGVFGEYAEEVAGNMMNAALVGDMTMDAAPDTGVFNLDQNIDTFLGVSLMGGFMSAIKTTGYRTPKYRARKDMTAKDDAAAATFGNQDKWGAIRNTLAFGNDEDVHNTLVDVLTNDDYSPEQRKATMEYAKCVEKYRGMQRAAYKRHTDGDEDPLRTDAETSYDNGYTLASAQEMNDAKNMLDYRAHKVDELFGINEGEEDELFGGTDPVQAVIDMRATHSDEQIKAAIDYLNAKATWDGMIDHVKDDIDSRVNKAWAAVDARTNKKDGKIHPATMKLNDRKVYIVGGNVAMTDDGTMVDNAASDASIIVRDAKTGNIEMVFPEAILRVDDTLDPSEEKQAAQEAIRQGTAQEAANKIDGVLPFAQGEEYDILDGQGNRHSVKVVQDMGDGTVAVDIDGVQNIVTDEKTGQQSYQPVIMSKKQIQDGSEKFNLNRLSEHEQKKVEQEAADAAEEHEATSPTYDLNDEVTLRDENNIPVRGSITAEENADGKIEVYTEAPVNGKKVNMFTRDELDGMLLEKNGEETPTAENASENVPETPETGTDETQNVPESQEMGTVQPQRAIDRIPTQEVDDGEGNVRTVHNWEQAEPGDTYDAIAEEVFDGDEKKALAFANNKVSELDKNIKSLQKKIDKAEEGTDLDAILAAKVQTKQLREQKAQLEEQKRYWSGVQSVPQTRRAEADRRTAEEEAAAKAAQEEAQRLSIEQARQERERVNGVPDVINDRPADARKRGFRNVNGTVVERQGETGGVKGRETNVKFSSKDTAKGRIKVIEADELQPSHVNGQRNDKFFIDEAQPKDRTDTVSSMAAAQIAANLNPEEITGDGSAYQFSAPTVNTHGEVIQGNNRSDALRLMWSSPAFKPAQDAYKQYIADHAEDFGLSADDVAKIQQMQHPVMVNELDVSDDEAIRLGQMKASDNESGGIERIDPVTTSQKLGGGKVSNFANVLLSSQDEDASLSDVLMQNGAKAVKWLQSQGAISATAAQSAFDRKGNLTPEARMDLQNILKQSLFQGGVSDLPAMFDRMPAKSQKAILSTFMRDFDSAESERILPEIQKAIEAWYGCAHGSENFAKASNYKGAKAAMHDWTLQTNLMDDNMPSDKFSNFAMELAVRLQGLTMRECQQSLNDFFDLVQGKGSGDLFGGSTAGEQTDRMEAIRRIFGIEYKPINNNNNGETRSNAVADNSTKSQTGQQGSTGDGGSRERAETGGRPANTGGRVAGNPSTVGTTQPEGKPIAGQSKEAGIDWSTYDKAPKDEAEWMDMMHFEYDGKPVPDAKDMHSMKRYIDKVLSGDRGIDETTNANSATASRTAEISEAGLYNSEKAWFSPKKYGDFIAFFDEGEKAVYKLSAAKDQQGHLKRVFLTKETFGGSEETGGKEYYSASSNNQPLTDAQGNPVDKDGKLIKEKVSSIDEITDEDFTEPTRTVELPELPENVDKAIGTNGKPVIIKKNIFEKNAHAHQFTPDESRRILNEALYNTDLVGQTQPKKRPNHWVAIKLDDESPITILEVNENKDNTEVVGWYRLDDRNLGRIKRQAEREGGELLILTPKGAAASLSTLPSSSSERKSKQKTETKQEKPKKKNEGQFGLVSDERMEELRKRLRSKLNNLNMGVDPEVIALGLELTVGHIDRGIRTFADFAKVMIKDLGDVVRPYLKAFYNGVRDMPEITENGLDREMDDYDAVSKFNIATIGKDGEDVHPSVLDTAEQVSNEQTVERAKRKANAVVGSIGGKTGKASIEDIAANPKSWIGLHLKSKSGSLVYEPRYINGDRVYMDEHGTYHTHETWFPISDVQRFLRDGTLSVVELETSKTKGEPAKSTAEKTISEEDIVKRIKEHPLYKEAMSERDEETAHQAKSVIMKEVRNSLKKDGFTKAFTDLVFNKDFRYRISDAAFAKKEADTSEKQSDADSVDAAVKEAKDAMSAKLEKVKDRLDKDLLKEQIAARDKIIDELDERVKNGERVGKLKGKNNVDLQATLLKCIGEREALEKALDNLPTKQSPKQNAENIADNPQSWIGKTFTHDGTKLVCKEIDRGRVLFENKSLFMDMAFDVDTVQGWLKSGKMKMEGETRVGSRGYTLRKATQKDLEQAPPVYVDGVQQHIMMTVRHGEQISATQFSKPRIERVYLTNGQEVPVDWLEVEDVPKNIDLHSVGDFYEVYGNEAVALGRAVGVIVAEKNGKKLAGFPKSYLDEYEEQLRAMGFEVSIDDNATPKAVQNINDTLQGGKKETTPTEKNNSKNGKKNASQGNKSRKKDVSLNRGQQLDLFGNSTEGTERADQPSLFDTPAEVTDDDLKGKEKPVEQRPKEELSGESAEYQKKAKAEQDFIGELRKLLEDKAGANVSDLTMADIRKMAKKYPDIADYSDTDLQELVERAVSDSAREIAITALWSSPVVTGMSAEDRKRTGYDNIVALYNAQPSLNARDSTRVERQQYSTPIPFGYVMDMFLGGGMRKPMSGLEPSAGNGALTIGFPAGIWHVNDIDERRLANLRTQRYRAITNQDGTLPFEPRAYDMVATNPPFGTTEERTFDGGRTKISSLEGLMAINALESMKDNGRAAIIIGGNTQYRDNGVMQSKDMMLFRYLYTHYNVVDVINLDGDMYKRNGTGYPVRMILIDGRKDVGENPEQFTIPPVRGKARAEQVKTFDELYKRVKDDIQQAKLERHQSADTVNGNESDRRSSTQNGVRDNQSSAGERGQSVRTGSSERGTRPATVRPAQSLRGRNGQRGEQSGASELDNVNGRDATGTGVVRNGQSTEGGNTVRQGSVPVGRGSERGGERGSSAERNNAGGRRLAVTDTAEGDGTQNAPQRTQPREKVQLGQEKVDYPAKSRSMSLQSRVPAAQADAIAENLDKLGDVDEMVRAELGYSSKDELFSHLAAEQIDSVALAIDQMKKGKGFIIGDMTGVGKGRQGAALIRWAVRQGKTPIYFTQKARLFTDNYRDICDIGSKELRPFIIASDPTEANIVEDVLDENGYRIMVEVKDKETGEMKLAPKTRVVHRLPTKKEYKRVYDYILEHGKLPEEYDYVLVTYSQISSGTETYELDRGGKIKKTAKKSKKGGKSSDAAAKNGDVRRAVLERLAEGNYVLLDESHTVGGQSSSGLFMQEMIGGGEVRKGVAGITYLSATFAKRADNMPLYALRTAMSESGLSQADMINAIQKGGVTLQEVMSKQLVQSAQMIRRERDFTGVSIDWEGVDEETDERQRAQFDEVAKIFDAIREFQDTYVDPAIADMSEKIAEQGEYAKKTQGTSHMGVNNVPFASKMYNLVNQLLFALKADAVADKAIELLKSGEYKPVISFSNTMEGFLNELPKGTPMEKLPDFSLTLMKALEGTLKYTVGDAADKDNQKHKALSLMDLDDEARSKYNEIRKTILDLSIGLPIDPMDAIKMKIEKAGYKVGEITGRTSEMVQDADGRYVVQSRGEKDGKAAASAFNNGQLDVLLINKSGSTGISLHASTKFQDQRQRVMIAAQFQSDINDEVQMRGRIDRTGQVHRGKYIYLVSSIPAEQRLQMMFKNKLKSLDANTTSSQKSKFNEMEVTDFMNKYGDEVTWLYMLEHSDLEERLGDPLKMFDDKGNIDDDADKKRRRSPNGDDEETSPKAGSAGKILRRLPFLSVAEQETIFNDLAEIYRVKIQLLNDAGENDLEITTMPLNADTKEKKVWKRGSDPDSDNAFADNTYLETCEVDVLKKPMKADEIRAYSKRLIDGKEWADWMRETRERVDAYFTEKEKSTRDKFTANAEKRADKKREKYVKDATESRGKGKNDWSDEYIQQMADIARKESIDNEQEKIEAQIRNVQKQHKTWLQSLDAFTQGQFYVVPMSLKEVFVNGGGFNSPGIFLGFRVNKNFSLSSSTAIFATLDGRRKVEIPLNDGGSLRNIAQTTVMNPNDVRGLSLDNWNSRVPTRSRETVHIVTGNLMQALVDTTKEGGNLKGQLISYTTKDGEVRQGVLMNSRFKKTDLKSSAPISSRLEQIRSGETVVSEDKEIQIEKVPNYGYGEYSYRLRVPKSKAKGGKYYLDKKLQSLCHGNGDSAFYTRGGYMETLVWDSQLPKLLQYLSKTLGVTVEEQAKLTDSPDMMGNDRPTTAAENEESGVLYREVDDEEQARLDKEPTETVYRAMQLHDGKLYPPMSGRVKTTVVGKNGKPRTKWVWREPSEIGRWEQSEEHPEKANANGTFRLDKGNGSYVDAAYNPYIHTSRTPINDQFSSAWSRPELVTVEVEVPRSELTSRYRAEKAKDATGEMPWREGSVSQQLDKAGQPRLVILSRWDKPVRIVPVEEVAREYAKRLVPYGIAVPFNCVNPELREALVRAGVRISEPENGNAGAASRPSYEEWLNGNTRERDGEGAYTDEELSLINDPVAKWLGYSTRTPRQQQAFAERERKNMASAVEAKARLLHLGNVRIVMDKPNGQGSLSRRERAKGYFDRATGEIVINIYNHKDIEDAMRTLLHESVAHYGLRQLFGSHFDTFLENVYKAADESVRRRITELALRKYKGNFHTATEEYLASLAETTDFEGMNEGWKGWWNEIKALFLDMLHAIGFDGFDETARSYGIQLSDNELRYILWRSYENLKEPGAYRSILGEAEDVAKQADLKVGSYTEVEAQKVQPKEQQPKRQKELKPKDWGKIPPRVADIKARHEGTMVLMPVHGNMYYEAYGEDAEKVSKICGTVLTRTGNDETRTAFPARTLDVYLPKLVRAGERIAVLDNADTVGEPEAWGKRDVATKAEQVSHGVDADLLFRDSDPTDGVADVVRGLREEYDKAVSKSGFQMQEAIQDSMLGLKKLTEIIQRHSKQAKIEDWENAYMAENALSSRNKSEADEYARKYYRPLVEALRALEKAGAAREDISDYVMVKHALERNREMSVRKALTDEDSGVMDTKRLKEWNKRKDDVRKDANFKTWREKQEELDRIATEEFGADLYERDYSGLTSIYDGFDNIQDCANAAYNEVETFEGAYDTDELNGRIRNATDATLEKLFTSGLVSKETLDDIKQMYDYYVPLRGFDETTAEEVYAYIRDERRGFNNPLKRAKGRSSKAENPFVYIANMADSAILQGNRNLMKQKFLNFVLNRPSDLVSISDMWIRKDPATGEWQTAFPKIPDNATADEVEKIVEQFNENMKTESEKADPIVKRIKGKSDVPYRLLHDELSAHQVIVKRGGREYVLTINGNPRAAMALNGQTNPHSDYSGVGGAFKKSADYVNRQLSAFYTTRNPDFVASNFVRDAIYSNSMVWVKESPRYAVGFHKNFVKFNPERMAALFHKYNHGRLDMSDPVEKEFYRFMMGGGETGYTNLKNIDEMKKKLLKDLRNTKLHQAKALLDRFDIINRSVENTARFAAYMTSRENGRSVERSVFDAKEISVNFNKKGAGGTFFGKTGQTGLGNIAAGSSAACRCFYVFFNAGVQGTTNVLRAAKNHKGKFATMAAAYFILGYVAPLLMGGGDGDDDDNKNYDDLPDYVRRTNLIFPLGDNYVSLPLPIEFRTMYGMGELASNVLRGKEHYTGVELARAMGEQVTQALPINFLEGEGTGLLSPFVPSIAAPIYQAHENKDWTGMPIYKDNDFNKKMPDWTKANGRTNRHLIDLARWMNNSTGGDKYTKGTIDMNPAVVESIVEGYFGGMVTFLNKMSNSVDMATGNMPFDWRNVPIGNRLIKSGTEATKQRAINREYFDNVEELEKMCQQENGYLKELRNPQTTVLDRAEYVSKLNELQRSERYRNMQAFEYLNKQIKYMNELGKNGFNSPELEADIWQSKREANEAARGTWDKDKEK